jgi:hypothetical protein
MQYTEEYMIGYVAYDGFMGCDKAGTFGPFPTEADGLSMMKKIEKKHDHVKHIHMAHLYRVSSVTLASYVRSRDTL